MNTGRRRFLRTAAGVLPAALAGRGVSEAQRRLRFVPASPGGGGQTALAFSDFTLDGYSDVQLNGLDSTYMRHLTHRYVSGQLRFLTLDQNGILYEFTPAAFLGTKTTSTQTWDLSAVTVEFSGIWWDEPNARLWCTASLDYGDTGTYYPTEINTITLGTGGATSNHKRVSMQGIPSKRIFGGVVPIPSAFQTAHSVGPYGVGFGGYTSLEQGTSRPSVGPVLYMIPDVAGYSNGAEIPSSAFKAVLDAVDGRGIRRTIPLNYFEGGDPRENPSTPPSGPPDPAGDYLSPNEDGDGWMVRGDSYYNNAVWIAGPSKQGFVMVATVGLGKCWYGSSTLHFDDRGSELHIWDTTQLMNGAVTNGLLRKPDVYEQLTLPTGISPLSSDGDTPVCNISGVTYDATTKKLYMVGYGMGANINTGRLYQFSVNA